MKDRVDKILRDESAVYIITGLICAVTFLFIYGYKILNPKYVSWLIADGADMSQHYLGFVAYRNSSWKFPLGMLDTLVYPNNSSVIFTDSIPIFAVFFKLFSFILPKDFQFFGLWGIACFILQGVFASRVVRNFTNSKVLIVISGVIFAFIPAMNKYTFTAIAGHWILLIGLDALLAFKKYDKNNKLYVVAAILGVLCTFVHIYFVPMCGIILVGIGIQDIINNKRIKRSIIVIGTFLGSVVLSTWLLGGLGGDVEATAGGLTGYCFNLNGFFNPFGSSAIFRDLPANESQGDNLAYLGAGCILLLAISLLMIIIKKSNKTFYYNNRALIISIFAVILFAVIFACSPQVTLNDKTLFELKVPEFVIKIWSIFRGCGRIVWAAEYLIILCTIIVLCKLVNNDKICICLLGVALLIQVYDLNGFLKEKNEFYTEVHEYHTDIFSNEFWKAVAADEEIKHIVYCSGDGMVSLTDYALKNNMTVNAFYFARSMDDMIEESRREVLESPSVENAYIFKKYKKMYCKKYNLHYYEAYGINEIDGVIVGLNKKLDGFQELDETYFTEKYEFNNDEYVDEADGYLAEDGTVLYSGGTSFGPEWKIPDGRFMVRIDGENIPDSVGVYINADKDETSYKYEIVYRDDSKIELVLYAYEELADLEICIQNNSEDSILLKKIELTYNE